MKDAAEDASTAVQVQAESKSGRRWKFLMALLLMVLLLFTGSYHWVAWQGQAGLYLDISRVPAKPFALLLGTAPTVDGRPNLYYQHRIQATVALWRAGKFKTLVLSGSRRATTNGLYDEIAAMRRDLMTAGIPPDRLLADPEAHRTLLSIKRARSVYGLSDYLLISQRFHCERALFIARDLGHNPVCFAAKDVARQPQMLARELFSRLIASFEALVN
ncbi:MAG: vancomycin resistance protein [Candidatus Melainabacteria bacterium HGW-Melainabacteria-1]|nr:MAG: vancomycin resistance protein [Candidatus Melainabacteria bacterium HGW-Melainabacteria-1]